MFSKATLNFFLILGGDDVDISSPIHRSEAKFLAEQEDSNKEAKSETDSEPKRKGLTKLAHLVQDINSWEDDLSSVCI